jgi:glycosyltransferase involved in cell wall biosynthesis
VSDPAIARPAICLNMIVKNETKIIHEALDSVAPYITSWVIVDTGSDDGTQDLVKNHMAALGIPGELYERPWRNFAANRTEALTLAQGHGEFIWILDADDMLVGTPDLTRLEADLYSLRYQLDSHVYWRPQLFRDGLRVRYEGVVHEYAVVDGHCVRAKLEGEYRIAARTVGARSQDPLKYAHDRDLLLAEVERNPEDARSVYYLAQSYRDMGDYTNARKWYARRVEMGGWAEEVYYSMLRIAECMARLDMSRTDVQDAYLQAWEFRPTRAEALYAIAHRYRLDRRFRLGYIFAERAAKIPLPEEDTLLVAADIHAWRATDEQAVCAFWIGKPAEAFTLCRRLLARPDIPDHDRRRIARNRDFSVPAMIEAASPYPDVLVRSLVAGSRDAEVTVSLIAGPERETTEQTLNSFVNCCTDVSRVGRFLVLDAGLSTQDRAALHERYRFLEFADCRPEDGPGAQLATIRDQINGRFWLHLGQDWRFFAPENFVARMAAVLEAEAQVCQVGLNLADAVKLTGGCAAEEAVRRAPDAGRYVLADVAASGPAMFDTTRLDQAGGVDRTDADPIAELGRRATAAGLQTASLDEVFCLRSDQAPPPPKPIEVRHPQPQPARSDRSTGTNGPIFVVGAGRSGTTLMRVMLDSHPRICCGPELKLLSDIAGQYQTFAGRAFRPVMESYGNTLADVQRQFRGFIEGLVENFRRASGKPRWAEKTPTNVDVMVPLGEIFPDARFIHILRDGRDVTCSLVTMDWINLSTGRKAPMVENMTAAARYWRNTITAAREQAAHPSLTGRVLEVRYEALVTETAATMREVLAFIGEEWDDAVLTHHTKDHRSVPTESSTAQAAKPVTQSALGRWKEDMTERDKAEFKAEAGALLTELGYAGADW